MCKNGVMTPKFRRVVTLLVLFGMFAAIVLSQIPLFN